nr:MAG TPA: hypothetical protein [Caudoviricetes sp.]
MHIYAFIRIFAIVLDRFKVIGRISSNAYSTFIYNI